MALGALSLSSLSSSAITIGGNVEAIATATVVEAAATAGSGTEGSNGIGDDKPDEIVCHSVEKEHVPDGGIRISAFDYRVNLSDFIMSAAATTTATSSSLPNAATITATTTTTSRKAARSSKAAVGKSFSNLALNSTEDVLLDELSSRFHGILPVQPSPLMLPSDHISSSLKSTRLNGHLIYCFAIGGECRLCFPQIISVVLRDVAINVINELFVDLNIHISVASQRQLETLKLAGIMPMAADSCGLITKSNAEYLVGKLLPQCNGYRLATSATARTISNKQLHGNDMIPVMHDCFDGCTGTLMLLLDTDEQIECNHCKLLFTGEKFVSHSHSIRHFRRICHWGFDSSNWRHYLHLPESCEEDVKALQKLHLYKYPPIRLGKRSAASVFTKFENGSACPKLSNLSTTATSGEVVEIGVQQQPLNKFNEQIPKLTATLTPPTTASTTSATAIQTTAISTANLTTTPTIPAVTLAQNSSIFPMEVSAIGTSDCYAGQPSSVTSLLGPQLQSLLALQLVTSQLPLTEPYKLPLSTANPSSHMISDIRWSDPQSSTVSSLPVINCNTSATDVKQQHMVVNDADLITANTTTNLEIPTCLTNSKTGTSLERLLDQTLKEPVLSVAKLLTAEFRRETELLVNQNEQLRRENILLRSALASSTVLVGLKRLNATNVPVS